VISTRHLFNPPGMRIALLVVVSALTVALLTGCLLASPAPTPFDPSINLDAETQALISHTQRSVFLIPFSHWDTDWHESFETYSLRADQNILSAIQVAKEHPRFRYTLEQVLFVQHFWEAHPESRADLKALVENRQITFAWGGITQPETSLAAPGVQWHNLLLGKEWIAKTFGPEFVPTSAWQSDAFGNSAALPLFLAQAGIPHLFLGRWQLRCDPGDQDCQPLPHAFYWKSPLASVNSTRQEHILVASVTYSSAWGALLNKETPDEQIAAFQALIEEQFRRTTSRYLFLPYGFDFLDPTSDLLDLVTRWNTTNQDTALVIADSETAFHYLASQDLPEVTVDLNPLWQAFYGTRPFAKIADKESEFYLTATDKFGLMLDSVRAGDWQTASINAHYDNISAVGYDQVWEASQRPRFEESVHDAAEQLASALSGIASRVLSGNATSPSFLIFNSLSWPRSGMVEVSSRLLEAGNLPLPHQRISPDTVAIFAEMVPSIGYSPAVSQMATIPHPTSVTQEAGMVTLSNGLASVRLDASRGGTFASLSLPGASPIELLSGSSDDLVYIEDGGDVYGARFGPERARQSQVPAQIDVLTKGPLVARARIAFALGGQPITKTITLRADSPLVEVTLQMKALPETTALMYTPTTLQTGIRTDDLGFAAFEHQVDTRPIQPGDITYRRKIFYPVMYWSDVSSGGYGLSLITHGLQGVGGAGNLYLLLARSVSDPGDQAHEGVTDTEQHTFHYAYYPHRGDADEARPWVEAYVFNQPLILVWRSGDQMNVQLPFQSGQLARPIDPSGPDMPATLSLASSEGGSILDIYLEDERPNLLVVDYDPSVPAIVHTARETLSLPAGWLWHSPVILR
jgi:hypothetical protein